MIVFVRLFPMDAGLFQSEQFIPSCRLCSYKHVPNYKSPSYVFEPLVPSLFIVISSMQSQEPFLSRWFTGIYTGPSYVPSLIVLDSLTIPPPPFVVSVPREPKSFRSRSVP